MCRRPGSWDSRWALGGEPIQPKPATVPMGIASKLCHGCGKHRLMAGGKYVKGKFHCKDCR